MEVWLLPRARDGVTYEEVDKKKADRGVCVCVCMSELERINVGKG